jgi:hypothetical protein
MLMSSYISFSQVVQNILEDLGGSTETTWIGLVVFTLQTYTYPSSLLGLTLSDLRMISGKEFGRLTM